MFLRSVLPFVLLARSMSAETLPPRASGELDIHHLSTGQGNATLFVLPDGTTLLVDAGAAPGTPNASPRPNDSRTPGEWVARYVERVVPAKKLDYVLVTHFHRDHMAGLGDVSAHIVFDTVLDRGWPDYDYPRPLQPEMLARYRAMVAGSKVERFEPGRNDQIVLRRERAAYPRFEIRNLTANGEYWTGDGDATLKRFPALGELAEDDFPSENMCSSSFRLRYGAFGYFTGGDLTGIPNVGHPAWQNMEAAIATPVGRVDVHVVNHHGSIDPASPPFLAALRPRVHIVPAWSATHPAPSVLKRLMSERAYEGERDVFVLELREPTKATIGPRAQRVRSDSGHVVVRVEAGGERYRVFVLSSADESGEILSKHGPYVAGP